MEEESSASASDARTRNLSQALAHGEFSPTCPSSFPPGRNRQPASIHLPAVFSGLLLILTAVTSSFGQATAHDHSLERVRSRETALRERQGRGRPVRYPDPKSPRDVTGFEVELMALLGKELGATPVFSQGQWDKLLQVLEIGRIDMVVNGYEWTESRAREYLATRPYYVYQLQVMAPRNGPIRSWGDLQAPSPEAGGGGSAS